MATATITTRPPLPPSTRESATQKVRMGEDGLEHSQSGKSSAGIRDRFTMEKPLGIHRRTNGNHCVPLSQMGKRVGLQVIKELWAFTDNRIAVRFAYEWHDDSGHWITKWSGVVFASYSK